MNLSEVEQIKLSLIEKLKPYLISEIEKEINDNFCLFSKALINNDIKSLLRAMTLINHLATELVGREYSEALCDRIYKIVPSQIKTATKEPLSCKELFFVWIGSININSLKYLAVWKKANPNYRVNLWFDSHCLLASRYSQIIRNHKFLNVKNNSGLIKFQNRAYEKIYSLVQQGASFDEAVIQFFFQEDAYLGNQLKNERYKAQCFYKNLQNHFQLNDVQQYASKIMDDEFYHLYFREIALRGNLACASDILRLHILYHFGGVYIDCDTLPNLEHIFIKTEEYCRQHKIQFSYLDVLKSELYLRQVEPLLELSELEGEPKDKKDAKQLEIANIINYLQQHYGEVVSLIEQDIHAVTVANAFKPLNDIWLYNNLLLLSADRNYKNYFYNNVMVANPNSKIVKIILREIRNRYRYLEKMEVIDIESETEIPQDFSYLSRLLNYRFDALDDKDNVTVFLTGPGLILEVVLGVGFSLLHLEDRVSAASLSYTLYYSNIGISFLDQTLHTFDHVQSTWMRV
jgi:hypothetical protein